MQRMSVSSWPKGVEGAKEQLAMMRQRKGSNTPKCACQRFEPRKANSICKWGTRAPMTPGAVLHISLQ